MFLPFRTQHQPQQNFISIGFDTIIRLDNHHPPKLNGQYSYKQQ